MDVADWLAGLGLERYADAFAAHAVDAELLATLTAEDLKEIDEVAPQGVAAGTRYPEAMMSFVNN